MPWSVPPGYRVYPPKVNLCREVLDRSIENGFGNRVALRFDGGEWTYSDLLRQVVDVARGMAALGVKRGQPVVLRSPNSPRACAAMLALFRLGALPVLTSSLLKAEELDYILDSSEARFAVAAGTHAEPLQRFLNEGRLDGLILLDGDTQGPGVSSWDQLVAMPGAALPDGSPLPYGTALPPGAAQPPAADTDALEPALLFYSSGTTGRPKGIVHGHKWIIAMGDIVRLQMEYRPGDVVMTQGEYSFMATWGHCLMAPLASGATVALYSGRPTPEGVFRSIAAYGVTKFMSVPTFYRTALAQRELARQFDLSKVEIWVSGGEALGAAPFEQWQAAFGRPLYDMYGITEMEVLIGNGPAHPVKPGSLGKAFPGLTWALKDEQLCDVPRGQPGRFSIHRSDPGMFLGYHKQPEKWRLAHRGDWYDTGDVMHCDEDGYFWYHGRQDDLFKTRGMFVSPQEVEDALIRHPAVAEVAVTGVPDERIGNAVCAFVVLKAAVANRDALVAELKATATSRLADYKVPQVVYFVASLPKSMVGKIVRRELAPPAD